MSWPRTLLIAALIVAAGYGGMKWLRHAIRPETRLEATACWFEKPALRNTECYRFTVPESRGTNSSRAVTLPVVILRSPSTPAEEPPVLHLAGGPGQPAGLETTAELASWADYLNRVEWARDRDHIIVDTRGVGGRADPKMRCAILSDMGWMLRVDRLKHDPRAYDAAVRQGVDGCRRGLTDRGINLAAYNSTVAAQDLIDLRHALKLPSWTIYGVSYGARLGLELMRRDPKGVHAAVLDSVPPPDVPMMAALVPNLGRVLDRMAADCDADETCAGAYPDLRQDVERSVLLMRARPLALTLTQPGGKRTMKVTIDEDLYLQVIEYGMINPDWLPFMPGIINDTSKGGTRLFRHLAAAVVFDDYLRSDANALLLSTLCYEEMPFNPPALFEAARTIYPILRNTAPAGMLRAECAAWPAGKAPDAFRAPVRSDVPVLLINGAYDTRTPAVYAEKLAKSLTSGFRLVLRAQGHAPSWTSPCAQATMAAFLQSPHDPTAPPCMGMQHPPRFMPRAGPDERIQKLRDRSARGHQPHSA